MVSRDFDQMTKIRSSTFLAEKMFSAPFDLDPTKAQVSSPSQKTEPNPAHGSAPSLMGVELLFRTIF